MNKFKSPFQLWCESVRERYKDAFNQPPEGTPATYPLSDVIQERMMRVGDWARHFNVEDEHDNLVILAHHTLLLDEIKRMK